MPIIDPNALKQAEGDSSFPLIRKITFWFEKIEDGILAGLLLLMILLAVTQIFLRNFLDIGIVWADILVRVLVLWLGLFGAMAACRKGDHIKIDLISRYLKTKLSLAVAAITDFFSAMVCVTVLIYSVMFVRLEYMDGMIAFGRIPVWLCQAIIPFSFLVMSARYFMRTVLNIRHYISQKAG